MSAILEVKNLVKKYADFTAVKGISFDIQAGEIFSLLGPNGAGKTTTISVRRLIGVVPQDLALYDDLTARENLVFWGQMYNLSGKALKNRIDEVLEQIGLTNKANQRVKTYSGGMKRRVNIGVGLLHKPSLLFMDEPTVGIDPQSRRAILDSVKALNQQGMTVLYTTHYMEEAQEISNRVGIMDHGELIAIGTQAELTRQVGENDALVLHMGENEAPQAITALAVAMRSVESVLKTDVTDHTVTVIAPQAEDILAPAVTKANEIGIKIRSVDIQEPNLEAVFLLLTGKALRD
jgi:ABC-2 type transport system ATP-binding protein